MDDFIYNFMIYLQKSYMMRMGEKLRNTKTKSKTKEKFPVWLPSHPLVYEMEADCFLVSENKPDP